MFFYSRVASRKSHRITLYAVGGVLITWTVAWFFVSFWYYTRWRRQRRSNAYTRNRQDFWVQHLEKLFGPQPATITRLRLSARAEYYLLFKAPFMQLLISPSWLFLFQSYLRWRSAIRKRVSCCLKVHCAVISISLLTCCCLFQVGLLVVYAIGFISLGATITRLTQATNLYFYGSSDVFLEARATFVMYSVWNALEVNTAIICANLPAFVPLIRNRSLLPTSAATPKVYHYPSDKSGSSFNKSGYSNGSRSSPSAVEKSIFSDVAAEDNIHMRTDINVIYDPRNVVWGLLSFLLFIPYLTLCFLFYNFHYSPALCLIHYEC